jgi:hypothetical protein
MTREQCPLGTPNFEEVAMKFLKQRCVMLTEATMSESSLMGNEEPENDDSWNSLPDEDDQDEESSLAMDTMWLFQGHRKMIPDLHEELPSQCLSIDLSDLGSVEFDG